MSPAFLAVALVAAMAALGVVLNHCQARLALIELTLNEGLPPGHAMVPIAVTAGASGVGLATLLGDGLHVFLSRNCHACQRLIEELEQSAVHTPASVHLRYIDRPRPIAQAAAGKLGAALHRDQRELASKAAADPLPFSVAVGTHGLVAQAVTPTLAQVVVTARDAGITVEVAS